MLGQGSSDGKVVDSPVVRRALVEWFTYHDLVERHACMRVDLHDTSGGPFVARLADERLDVPRMSAYTNLRIPRPYCLNPL